MRHEMKPNKDRVSKLFLEKPITSAAEDCLEVSAYADLLNEAIENGANFIAVDGGYGSGKSSIVNLLKHSNNGAKFVDVTFLDIASEFKGELDNSDGNNPEPSKAYNRIFISQIASQLCPDPYKAERLFYRDVTSYSVLYPFRNKIVAWCVDKLLLFAVSAFLVLTVISSSFLKNVPVLTDVISLAKAIAPILAVLILILVLANGFGIYRPKQQEQSPMLNIDRCRLIYQKIIHSYTGNHWIPGCVLKRLPKLKQKLVVIVDELDRVNPEVQASIVKLLYNEYRPLKFSNTAPIFIFMVNTRQLNEGLGKDPLATATNINENDEEQAAQVLDLEISSNKLFDYILPISSNQKQILYHLLNNLLDKNAILSDIFRQADKSNYLKGLICQECKSLREIKHLLNKVITKHEYLKCKKIDIDYDMLIATSILCHKLGDEEADKALAAALNATENQTSKDVANEFCKLGIISPDYYIYIYNFVDQDDLFNYAEQQIYKTLYQPKHKISAEDIDKIIKLLEQENEKRFHKVYDEIYSGLNDELKLIFLGSERFFIFLHSVQTQETQELLKNSYRNQYAFQIYKNLKIFEVTNRDTVIDDLIKAAASCAKNDAAAASDFHYNIKLFIQNTKEHAADFPLCNVFANLQIDDEVFDLLHGTTIDEQPLLFILVERGDIQCEQIIDRIDVDIINEMLTYSDKQSVLSLLKKVIAEEDLQVQALARILGYSPDKYEGVEELYKRLSGKIRIGAVTLQNILKKYGYSYYLDEHIVNLAKEDAQEVINLLKNGEYEITPELMGCLADIPEHLEYTPFYEEKFITSQHFNLYVWSKTLRTKRIDFEAKWAKEQKYISATIEVYMDNNTNQYTVSKNARKELFPRINWDTLLQNHCFQKVFTVIPDSPTEISSLIDSLSNFNCLEEFCLEASRDAAKLPMWFLKQLRLYADKRQLSGSCKRLLTIGIKRHES